MIEIKKSILNKAYELGFDIVRFVKPEINKKDIKSLKIFLEKKNAWRYEMAGKSL